MVAIPLARRIEKLPNVLDAVEARFLRVVVKAHVIVRRTGEPDLVRHGVNAPNRQMRVDPPMEHANLRRIRTCNRGEVNVLRIIDQRRMPTPPGRRRHAVRHKRNLLASSHKAARVRMTAARSAHTVDRQLVKRTPLLDLRTPGSVLISAPPGHAPSTRKDRLRTGRRLEHET